MRITHDHYPLRRLAGLVASVSLSVCHAGCAGRSDQRRIEDVLLRQSAAWNAGDIVSFMTPYWHSDELTFSSAGETTRGWQATLNRYKQRYPDRRAMGTLRFADLEITLLSRDVALVLGTWHLARDDGDIGGGFSLVFQRMGGKWVIRHDHTSRRDAP